MALGHEKLNVYQLSIAYVDMLSRLGGRGYCVKEGNAAYECTESDLDFDEREFSTWM